jgi:hypothetical protein
MNRIDPDGDRSGDSDIAQLAQEATANVSARMASPDLATGKEAGTIKAKKYRADDGKISAEVIAEMKKITPEEARAYGEETGDYNKIKQAIERLNARSTDPVVDEAKRMNPDKDLTKYTPEQIKPVMDAARQSLMQKAAAKAGKSKPRGKVSKSPRSSLGKAGVDKGGGGFNPGYNFWLHRGPNYGTNPTSAAARGK